MRDGTRTHEVEEAGYAAGIDGPASPSSLDLTRPTELRLLEALHVINAHVATTPDPAGQRITLTRFGQAGQAAGNPAEWAGFDALTIAVWNPNAFTVGLGTGGSGSGDPTRPGAIVIGASRLVVLPIADRVYSFGTAAANIAAADATVWAWRYAVALPPAIYAL